MNIQIKRIYQPVELSVGTRILVDRLWPRGISKETAKLACWAKEISPSNELRKWYNHEEDKWQEFKQRYISELKAKPEVMDDFKTKLKGGTITLLFSSKELELNNASALKEYIESLAKH